MRVRPDLCSRVMASSPLTSSQTRTQRAQTMHRFMSISQKGSSTCKGRWRLFVGQRGIHLHLQIPHRILEFAALVLGAGDAPVVDRDVPEADVGGTAEIDAVAGQAAVGVLGEEASP